MYFETFLKELSKRKMGIASFITTQEQFVTKYELKISQYGDRGWFIKNKGVISDLEKGFDDLINEFDKW